MFGLFSRKKQPHTFDYSLLKVDMHSHVLPGLDDGAATLDDSLQMIAGFKEIGFTRLITTPHILWDMYKNTPDMIRQKLDLVQNALVKNNIEIELHAAAEYFLDDHLAELIKNKQPLLTLKDNWVLVEFSTMHMSMNMKEILFDLLMAGYQPVLAHPERYSYLNHDRGLFDDFKQNGIFFQLNILSLTGGYGKPVTELAHYLISKGYYNLLGTDMHHIGHLERLKDAEIADALQHLMASGNLINASL